MVSAKDVKVKLRVNMVVCKINLGRRVDIKRMAAWLGRDKKSTSKKLIVKMGGGKRMWLFRTGSGVLSGFRNMKEIHAAVKQLASYLRIKPERIKVGVANIQASGSVNYGVDLDKLARAATEDGYTIQYIPSISEGGFPNLYYHIRSTSGTAIISSKGAISVVGIKKFSDIPKIRKELAELFSKYSDCLRIFETAT